MYQVIEVPPDSATLLEQLGTKAKVWYQTESGESSLFKQGRPGTGENWAEKVACELCRELGIPHAEYELAVWRERRGVVSPNFVGHGERLVHANEFLGKLSEEYDQTKRYKARQHTVRRAMILTAFFNVPNGFEVTDVIRNGADVFVGYLMLDALIGNQDRHHENWGLIVNSTGLFLAPTFDHASSLGRNEQDSVRLERLETKDHTRSVDTFARRARSAFYPSAQKQAYRPLLTIDAFLDAARRRPDAGQYWVDRLKQLSDGEIFRSVLANIPRSWATQTARDFAHRMLEVNLIRICDRADAGFI